MKGKVMVLASVALGLLLVVVIFNPPVGSQGQERINQFTNAADQLSPRFASNVGQLDNDGTATGIALGDFDNDGDIDVYLPNNGNPNTLPFLLNGSIPPGRGAPTNFVDPEGDGAPNSLYKNIGDTDGDGLPNFVDVAAGAGVEDRIGIGHGAVFADFDNDGDLDLYVANGMRYVTASEFGIHQPMATELDLLGFRDPGGPRLPPFFVFDSERGQFNGAFVTITDPVTGQPRGEARNTLFKNLLAETGQARFSDVTEEAGDVGGTKKGFPGGRNSMTPVVADVNNDGFLDVYVTNFLDLDFAAFWRRLNGEGVVDEDGDNFLFNGATNRLYINNGDFTFTDVTDTAGVGTGSVFMFDITGNRRVPYDPNLRDIAGNPVGERATNSWTAAFNDYDHDGDQDLWVANDVPYTVNLFRNDTPPGAPADQVKFTDVSRPSGTDFIGNWMGFAFGDIDRDEDLDVFVTNMGSTQYTITHLTNPNQQRIDSGGEFNRWTHNGRLHGMFRNDGTRTVTSDGQEQVVGTFPNVVQAVPVQQSRFLPPKATNPANLSPQKQPIFGLATLEFGFGTTFLDYNNDGYDDLYVIGSLARGGDGVGGTFNDNPGRLLVADGRGGFRDLSVEAHALDIVGVNYANVDAGLPPAPEDRINTQFHEHGRAVATGDLNGDGFPDLILTNSGGFDSNLPDVPVLEPNPPPPLSPIRFYTPGPLFVLINDGANGNQWLKVRLVGGMTAADGPNAGKSNRSAIGAFVRAEVYRNGAPDGVLIREVRAGESYMASNSSELIFGLGQGDVMVRRLEIRWPSGEVDVVENVRPNQTVTIKEGEGIMARFAHAGSSTRSGNSLLALWLAVPLGLMGILRWRRR